MGAVLFGGLKTYADIPFLNENPMFSGVGGCLLVLLFIVIFPRLLGLFFKFALFVIVVLGICHACGLDFDAIVEKLSKSKLSFAIDAVRSPTGPKIKGSVTGLVNGNTFLFNGDVVRLYGIDVPDLKQNCKANGNMSYACGEQALAELDAFLNGKEVVCALGDKDASGVYMATCYVDEEDVAALMVHDGWAVADKKQSQKYVEEEKSAYLRKAGLWNGKFEAPWVWRAKHVNTKQNKTDNQKKSQEGNNKTKELSPLRGIKKLLGMDK